jgi:hypothetical protein
LKIYKIVLLAVVLLAGALAFGAYNTLADKDKDKDNDHGLSAKPFVFVGTGAQCAPSPAGSNIVTSAWLRGMGLPDNGGANTTAADLATNPNKKDPHTGLLLNKNGPTLDCSSSGATIKGVKGMIVTSKFELGYDFRNGGHCGAGAPRFNVDTDMGFFFVGCANAPKSPAPQDQLQWTRTRSVLSTCGIECFPRLIPVGAKIKSINIVFDEGTDTANNDTEGVGLAVLDNIDINGTLIGSGNEGEHRDSHDKGGNDDND